MTTVQAGFSLSVEFECLNNVDLFRRGYYRVQLSFSDVQYGSVKFIPNAYDHKVEDQLPACVENNGRRLVSSSVLLMYQSQCCMLADRFEGRLKLSLPLKDALRSQDKVKWPVVVANLDLLFVAWSPDSSHFPLGGSAFEKVSTRAIRLHISPTTHQLHANRSMLFEYCCLASISLQVHCALTSFSLMHPPLQQQHSEKASFMSLLFNWTSGSSSMNTRPPQKRSGHSESEESRPSWRSRMTGPMLHRTRSHVVHASSSVSRRLSSRSSRSAAYEVDSELNKLPRSTLWRLCTVLIECKVALEGHWKQLTDATIPKQRDIEITVNDILRTVKCAQVSRMAAEERLSFASDEVDDVWQMFFNHIDAVGKAGHRLAFEFQYKRISRCREAIFLQKNSISDCLTLNSHIPRLAEVAAALSSCAYATAGLAPLCVECPDLDGTPSTIPLILEQRFHGSAPTPPDTPTACSQPLRREASNSLIPPGSVDMAASPSRLSPLSLSCIGMRTPPETPPRSSPTQEEKRSENDDEMMMNLVEFLSSLKQQQEKEEADKTGEHESDAGPKLSWGEFLASLIAEQDHERNGQASDKYDEDDDTSNRSKKKAPSSDSTLLSMSAFLESLSSCSPHPKHTVAQAAGVCTSPESRTDLLSLQEFLSVAPPAKSCGKRQFPTGNGITDCLSLSEFLDVLSERTRRMHRNCGHNDERRASKVPSDSSTPRQLTPDLCQGWTNAANSLQEDADERDVRRIVRPASLPETLAFSIDEDHRYSTASSAVASSRLCSETDDPCSLQKSSRTSANLPSAPPTAVLARQSQNLAKEDIRVLLPSSWTFLSDSPLQQLPEPMSHVPVPVNHPHRHRHKKAVHLVVCVHGLQGVRDDLRMFRVFLEMALPNEPIEFLMSKENEGRTFSQFSSMIDRMVDELTEFIHNTSLNVSKLSFVGHSLGNIIIRGALGHPALAEYIPKLHVFISFAGPHLGTVYSNAVISKGMWLMRKWKKSGSLQELALKDATDLQDTFLYKLSQKPGLALFKSVLLVASQQDQYVPFSSARIELSSSAGDDQLGRAQMEMIQNLLCPLQQSNTELVLFNVLHRFSGVDVNVLLGRAGHVAMLDSDIFLEKFVFCCCQRHFL